MLPRQNQCDSGVLVASMASTWSTVEVATCDELIYPGELPVGLSKLLSRGPPFTFSRPLAARCRASTYVPPFQVPRGPPAMSPVCSVMSCHPGEPPWGQHAQSWGPHSRSAATYSPVSSFPTCKCWAQSCCCRWRRGRPSRWASQSSACCRPPPRSSPHSLWKAHSPPTSSLTC